MPPLVGQSFEDYLGQDGSALLQFATLVCGNRSDAEDVLQDVLIAVGRRWDTIRHEASRRAYVERAITRRWIDVTRRRRREVLTDEIPEGPYDDPDFLSRTADREVVGALNQLPGRQRLVLVLRYVGGWADEDIAEAVGCAPGTVKSIAHRGLTAVRGLLAADLLTRGPEGARND